MSVPKGGRKTFNKSKSKSSEDLLINKVIDFLLKVVMLLLKYVLILFNLRFDFAFAFKTQNAPCVSRFKRFLLTDRFQFAF